MDASQELFIALSQPKIDIVKIKTILRKVPCMSFFPTGRRIPRSTEYININYRFRIKIGETKDGMPLCETKTLLSMAIASGDLNIIRMLLKYSNDAEYDKYA